MSQKRLRIIAGPNGSGKSVLKINLEREVPLDFYEYLNADELLKDISDKGYYEFRNGEKFEDLQNFAAESSYKRKIREFFANGSVYSKGKKVFFKDSAVNAYAISLLVAFLSSHLILAGKSFSFETVFSSDEKIKLIRQAADKGYKVYIYCISTEVAEINVGRIENRVADGGHDVPSKKVKERYPKSLKNIAVAIDFADRAYFFDNTSDKTRYIASRDKNKPFHVHVKEADIPKWFMKYFPIK